MGKKYLLAACAALALASGFAASNALAVTQADPGCCAPPVCPQPCISYRYARCRKVCCGCEAPVKAVLAVADPCCCKCVVNVPVCIPACCQGEPCVSSHCGLFGRGVVCYEWCCGFKVKVAFTRCGDVNVTYFGA